MTRTDDIRHDIVGILESQLGRITAEMYQHFYEGKDVETMVASLSELLTEFIGPQKKKEIMQSIQQKYPEVLHV